ncbi:MAG: DNRLRE domain-containing protein [Actinomycetota bacterium]|nr:DNRLRE domain-containing protein [Actinomycetota bacterium]
MGTSIAFVRVRAMAGIVALAVAAALMPGIAAVAAQEPLPDDGREIARLRTATSKTFRNDDGSFTTKVFTGPVHFRAGGEWREIDTKLVSADAPEFDYRSAAAPFRALFKDELEQGFMRFVASDRAFDLSLDAAIPGSSRRSRSGLAYADVFPGVDVSYDVVPTGVKETLILNDGRAPARYRFYLDTTDARDFVVTELEDGRWTFQHNRDEEPLFVLDAPYALDAADADFELPPAAATPEPTPPPSPSPSLSSEASPSETEPPSPEPGDESSSPEPVIEEPEATEEPAPEEPAVAAAPKGAAQVQRRQSSPVTKPEDTHVDMKVTRVGERFAIDLSVDAAWLHDRDRVFPVLVDPSLTIQPSLEDANFNASCATCTPTLRDRNYIGMTDSNAWRTAIQFDLGDIPAGAAQVSDAQLKLYYGNCIPAASSCSSSSHQLDVHRMTGAWSTSSTTQSLGFDPTPLTSYTLASGADHSWMNWNITQTVKNWLSGTQTNFGVLVKRSTESPLGISGPRPPGWRYTAEASLRPALEVTWTADAVTLASPDTLHSDGAELSWTQYAGTSAFASYEVHRSATNRFTPSASTLLATIGTKTTTRYRDTTAAPSKTFSYKIVTNGNVSNERTVTLPADGKATKILQPMPVNAKGTYVTHDTGYTVCDNNGAKDKLYVGAESTYLRRPVVKFDLTDVPSSSTIIDATMSLWHGSTIYFSPTVTAHRVTSAWKEGSGNGNCSRNGATWYDADGVVAWASQGVDFASTAAASVTNASGETAGWDDFNLTTLTGDWLSGKAPNHGVLVKLSDETLASGRAFSYWADDFTASPTLRPKMVVNYNEPVHAEGPTVTLSAPGPGAEVSNSVTLAAGATDDRRVDKVEFLVDGNLVGTDTSAPYSVAWSSTSVGNGTRSIAARATDDAGNVTTSTAINVTVGNSAAPAVSLTAPTSGSNVSGSAVTLSANATDDGTVSRVEFLVDGLRIGDPDTTSPYAVTWNTLDPAVPLYDGSHQVTAKAWDNHGNVTTSSAVSVTSANTAGTKFKATVAPSSAVPQAMTYDPSKSPQDVHYVDLSVTNTSSVTWAAADVVTRFAWVRADGTRSFSSGDYNFASDVAPGASRTVRVGIYTPALATGEDKAEYKLRFDLYSKTSAAWFGDKGNAPSDHPILVNKAIEATALGLERYYHYEGEALGAGMSHLTNVASGNSLLRWTPFSAPGRGLSTNVDITYNSLEDKSDSPIGNNFSLGISTLSRFGLPLDVHPNNADTIAGRSNKYIEFTDSDGTTHRFTGNAGGGWDEPPGVHLYLRQYSTTDAQRKWALTRPDRVTFFYDDQGFPTSVEDKNGNRIQFTWENIPSGEDPGGAKRRITTITDAAGLGASPAPNRSFTIDYYSKAEAKKPQVRGKIEKITDHNGSALVFDYYDDGNLLRMTQKGGTNADGSFLADRSFVFTYTTSDGSAAAIPVAGNRQNPDAKTPNQSTRLYSVRDPREHETTFVYYGPASGELRWKLQSRTNRTGNTTSFSYDLTNRVTTVTAPESRVSKFGYDTQGKVTSITNPKNEVTTVEWTTDRHVKKVTEPTTKYVEYAYNDNGYVTDVWDQLRNRTTLTYQNLAVDADDVSSKWKAGRTIGHVSQLQTKTSPKGTATTTPTDDFMYTFQYDTKGNLTKVIEPANFNSDYTYNPDGTLATYSDANQHTTTYSNYDANGLPTTITDPITRVTKFGFDDDGLLQWVQEPIHATLSGGDPRRYRTYFDYDSFHRLGRQSRPKLARSNELWPLIWSATNYDANDNVTESFAPEEGQEFVVGPKTTNVYDFMDRIVSSTNPDSEKTEMAYDAAGRLTRLTTPKGVISTGTAQDHATFFEYDPLDRVIRRTRYDTAPATPKALTTHFCFNLAGDLFRRTAPKADLATVDCSATTPPAFTTRMAYDDAHRLLTVTDPLGRPTGRTYDANGNVETTTDALSETTTFTYDQRDMMIKKTEPFSTTRPVVTKYEYDGVGNLKKLTSPRAYDAALASLSTNYVYDNADQLVRVELPYLTGEPGTFIYRKYDANGNVERTSVPVSVLPTNSDLWAAMGDKMYTSVEYFDTGLPKKTEDHVNAAVVYDYNGRGQQIRREVDGDVEIWRYYPDGMLQEHDDREASPIKYEYDPNNNLKVAEDYSGLNKTGQDPIRIEVAYDTLDRVSKVRHRSATAAATDTYEFTSYDYDLNGNVIERKENGKENPDGSVVTAPRSHTFVYDGADWLQTQYDSLPTGCQKVENKFTATGLEELKRIFKSTTSACDPNLSFTAKQSTVSTYFKNGLLKSLRTYNGNVDPATLTGISPAITLEKHDLSYVDSAGIYVNGHRTVDNFFRDGPSTTACRVACYAKYVYDGRDRVLIEDRGYAADVNQNRYPVTEYELTDAGNVKKATTKTSTLSSATVGSTTTYGYEGTQLKTVTAGSITQTYMYDTEGNLECVVTNSPTECPTGAPPSTLVKDYEWDDLNRLERVATFSGGNMTDEAVYTHDALDRVVKEVERHSGTTRTTNFSFLGLTDLVTKETFSGTAASEQKTYSYDAYDKRISMMEDPAGTQGPKNYTYAYDVHGSVSLLLDDSGGWLKATYGYDAYGNKDNAMSGGDPDGNDPFNPYRYSARRLDSGSGTLDMGFRRFGPDGRSFLQPDSYQGAVANLGLSMDPLTGNRYSLAAGNPVSFVEFDGHALQKSGPGGTSVTDPEDENLTKGSTAYGRAFDEQQVIDYKHKIGNREKLWDAEVERWYRENGLPTDAIPEECQSVPVLQVGRTMSECFFHAKGIAPSGQSHGPVDPPSDAFSRQFTGRSWEQVQDIKDVVTGGGQVCLYLCLAVAIDSDGISLAASGVSGGRGRDLGTGFGANFFLTSGEQAPGSGSGAQACGPVAFPLCGGGYVNKSGTQGSLIGIGTPGFEVGPYSEFFRHEFDD